MKEQSESIPPDLNLSQDITVSVKLNNNDDDDDDQEENYYGISDPAPWSLALLSGIQHFLSMVGGTLFVPHLLFNILCIRHDDPARAELVSAMFFVLGIVTILQSAIGCRLPIMQGSTVSYLVPTIAVLGSAEWKCTFLDDSLNNSTNETTEEVAWHSRINMIQGSLMLASLLEIVLGLTGLVGIFLHFITPSVIAPVLTLLGFAVLEEALDYANGNWAICILTVVLLIIFSENLKNIHLPWFSYSKKKGLRRTKGIPIFQFFPVLLVIIIVWIICIILTKTDVLSTDDRARTDLSTDFIERTTWFRFPYPTQWGYPTFCVATTVGMLGASLVNIIESVGNYYACARVSGAPHPPVHAINRGIFIEGCGSFLEALLGLANGTASYAENVGIIGITKMASRRVMYTAGFIMILVGLFTKVGALVVAVPDPIVGGVLIILFSSIATVGLANLQYIDMNSSRNLLVIGFPLFCGLAFPQWLKSHKDFIQTGNKIGDSILTVLLSTGMFLGGLLGLILDNLIPGTPEERGMIKWNELKESANSQATDYDLPFGMSCIEKWSCLKYIPILPIYKPFSCSCKKSDKSLQESSVCEKLTNDIPHENNASAV